jgi:hypothetical protein
MAYRKIPLSEKIKIFIYIFSIINKTEIAKKFGIDPSTLIDLIEKKVIPALKIILVNKKPGPKSSDDQIEFNFDEQSGTSKWQDERPASCPHCGSSKVWKNGFYFVLNWLMLLLPIKINYLKEKIQRYICGDCNMPISSQEKDDMAEKRNNGKVLIKRLIVFSKFKLRLSHRLTQLLINFVYPNITVSIRYVDLVTQRIGTKSRAILNGLKDIPQKIATIIMGDETFPRIIGKGVAYGKSIAIVICEYGVIRTAKVVTKKSLNLKSIFQDTMGKAYNPKYFLSDYDKLYPKLITAINKNIIQLKDIVHTFRIIYRHFETAIRNITIDYPKTLPLKQRKRQKKLKQRLLRKHLKQIKYLFCKAFASGYEATAHLYIYGALNELENFPIQNQAIKTLYKVLKKFFDKYIDTLVFQLENRDNIISTTNALESKNSIFKAFTRAAKSYQTADTCEKTINGIALMENFDVKTRGVNKGTSAFSRANIQLNADNFFDCVGLTFEK